MQKHVTIRFSADEEISIPLHAGTELPSADEARRWLDEQYADNECVPLRSLGKVLMIEKPLGIAAAVGPKGFDDAAFRDTFARMTLAALDRPTAHIDLEALTLR